MELSNFAHRCKVGAISEQPDAQNFLGLWRLWEICYFHCMLT